MHKLFSLAHPLVFVDLVTALIAIYGAALSTYLAWLRRKDDIFDIRVSISKIVDDDPQIDPQEAIRYTILVRNFGKRIAYIDSIRLKLQYEGEDYPFKSLEKFKNGLAGDVSIPYELSPGRKLETSVDYWDIGKFVECNYKSYEDGHPDYQFFVLDPKNLPSCKLIAYLEDQLGKNCQSEPVDIS